MGTVGSGTNAVVPNLLSGYPDATSMPLGEEVRYPWFTLPLGSSACLGERVRVQPGMSGTWSDRKQVLLTTGAGEEKSLLQEVLLGEGLPCGNF